MCFFNAGIGSTFYLTPHANQNSPMAALRACQKTLSRRQTGFSLDMLRAAQTLDPWLDALANTGTSNPGGDKARFSPMR